MKFILSIVLLFACSANAVVETYEFETDVMRDRYNSFVEELRCPKCQNQNLAGSNSPISADLRNELYRQLKAGQSDQQITEYMLNRYGDFILYRPQFNSETAVLWMAPVIFLMVGATIAVIILKRQRAAVKEEDGTLFAEEEQEQLRQLLEEDGVAKSRDMNKRNNRNA
ncbi:MAG: cytochrome c-type biogenesis protein CcmH [Gammaproteobacteria bacterium]|jgi:cytochrome c-type biogenesis protein CcmH